MNSNQKTLWNIYHRCERGERHKEADLLCQDRAAYRQKGNKQAIVLVDGSGKTNLNAVAGELLSEKIADFFLEEFEEIIELLKNHEKTLAKKAILSSLKVFLYRFAKKCNQSAEEFKYTMMAICVDHEKGQYCGMHCGDGVMTFSRENGTEILSMPVNGLKRNQTYFITSEGAEDRFKVFYGSLEDVTEFSLITDGAYQKPLNPKQLGQVIETMCDSRIETTVPIDDRSIILLRRKQDEQEGLRE